MSALYLSIDAAPKGLVRSPRPADAIGAALRGVFRSAALPDDMNRLLRQLNRPR